MEAFIGKRFGRLTVKQEYSRKPVKWLCLCDCGGEALVLTGHLNSGHTRSCGCLMREATAKRNHVHGHTTGGKFSPEYHSWAAMITRCENPTVAAYRYYGARGIAVCDRWRESFENFLADMGERPEGRSLDRINVNGNYEPGNCRWATASEQSGNRRKITDAYRVKIIDLVKAAPKTLDALYTILGIHPECVKKEVRKLRASGVITTTSVPTGVPKGKTLLCEFCGID